MTIGFLKALHKHNFHMPEDVAVVGFNVLGFTPFLNPPLTQARAPAELVSRIATERLIALLENKSSSDVVVLVGVSYEQYE